MQKKIPKKIRWNKSSNIDPVRGGMVMGDNWGNCSTCGVMPWWQADGFLQEAELGVVKPECLVDNVRCRLHVHLADGHGLAIFCFKCHLWREGERSAVSAAWNSPAWCPIPTAINSIYIITTAPQAKLMG